MRALIIGGTSGLGLEIAKSLRSVDTEVYVTGRRKLNEANLHYIEFNLGAPDLPKRIETLVKKTASD